jgi:hypothetical protein
MQHMDQGILAVAVMRVSSLARQRDWTERKYATWQRGSRMLSQKPSSLMTCRCGQVFDDHRLEQNLVHVPHISAAASEHAR